MSFSPFLVHATLALLHSLCLSFRRLAGFVRHLLADVDLEVPRLAIGNGAIKARSSRNPSLHSTSFLAICSDGITYRSVTVSALDVDLPVPALCG